MAAGLWVATFDSPLAEMFAPAKTVMAQTPAKNSRAPSTLRVNVAKEYQPPGVVVAAIDPSSTWRIASRNARWLRKNELKTDKVLRPQQSHAPRRAPSKRIGCEPITSLRNTNDMPSAPPERESTVLSKSSCAFCSAATRNFRYSARCSGSSTIAQCYFYKPEVRIPTSEGQRRGPSGWFVEGFDHLASTRLEKQGRLKIRVSAPATTPLLRRSQASSQSLKNQGPRSKERLERRR